MLRHVLVILQVAAALAVPSSDEVCALQAKSVSRKIVTLPDNALWYVFLDGRDAPYGELAYGQHYALSLRKALHSVYDVAEAGDAPLTFEFFEKIMNLLEQEWRPYPNVGAQEFDKCRGVLPPDVANTLASDMAEFRNVEGVDAIKGNLTQVIDKYNKEQAAERADPMGPLVTLMRRLAFLHPLGDSNGRSRLLLLQLELRRKGIAGGIVRNNNNKDVYFETAETFRRKVEEGIAAYKHAAEGGGLVNPWLLRPELGSDAHKLRCPGYTAPLQACWRNVCDDSTGCGGTSPSLLQPSAAPGLAVQEGVATYLGTTDTEVEAMSTFDPVKHKLHRGESVNLCSVAGGMSGLSLLPSLSGMMSSISFFDHNPQEVAKAELWVALIRMSPSRNKFLERLYSKKAFDNLAKFTPQSMAELLNNAPFENRIFKETETELYCESTGPAVKLYQRDVASSACARTRRTDFGCGRVGRSICPKTNTATYLAVPADTARLARFGSTRRAS